MRSFLVLILGLGCLGGCAPTSRLGMVEDPATGLLWGSATERNIVIDASQFQNKAVKVSVRNVSGDTAYDLSGFKDRFRHALLAKGYKETDGDEYGIKFDVNVMYSGYIRQDMASEFGFLGGSAGAVAGYRGSNEARGMVGGAIVGATIGTIIGSHTRDETYIVVAEVTIGVADQHRGSTKRTITFSASPPREEEHRSSIQPFESVLRTKVAVYAGGRNVSQSQIASGVRERLSRIIADVI